MKRDEESADGTDGSRGLLQRILGAISTLVSLVVFGYIAWAAWTNGGWIGRSFVIGVPLLLIVAVLVLVLSK